MNLNTTMELLWVNHEKLKYLTQELANNGFNQAHAELDREQYELGNRLLQIEAVIEMYQQDIAVTQLANPDSQPKFYGVDMGNTSQPSKDFYGDKE